MSSYILCNTIEDMVDYKGLLHFWLSTSRASPTLQWQQTMTSRLFIQQLVQVSNKENTNALYNWNFVGDSTSDNTKGNYIAQPVFMPWRHDTLQQ